MSIHDTGAQGRTLAMQLRFAGKFLRDCRGTEPWEFFQDHARICDEAASALSTPRADVGARVKHARAKAIIEAATLAYDHRSHFDNDEQDVALDIAAAIRRLPLNSPAPSAAEHTLHADTICASWLDGLLISLLVGKRLFVQPDGCVSGFYISEGALTKMNSFLTGAAREQHISEGGGGRPVPAHNAWDETGVYLPSAASIRLVRLFEGAVVDCQIVANGDSRVAASKRYKEARENLLTALAEPSAAPVAVEAPPLDVEAPTNRRVPASDRWARATAFAVHLALYESLKALGGTDNPLGSAGDEARRALRRAWVVTHSSDYDDFIPEPLVERSMFGVWANLQAESIAKANLTLREAPTATAGEPTEEELEAFAERLRGKLVAEGADPDILLIRGTLLMRPASEVRAALDALDRLAALHPERKP